MTSKPGSIAAALAGAEALRPHARNFNEHALILLADEVERLQHLSKECSECAEQSRLLGMSAEREAALQAENGRLIRERFYDVHGIKPKDQWPPMPKAVKESYRKWVRNRRSALPRKCEHCGGTGLVNHIEPNKPPVACPMCQPGYL